MRVALFLVLAIGAAIGSFPSKSSFGRGDHRVSMIDFDTDVSKGMDPGQSSALHLKVSRSHGVENAGLSPNHTIDTLLILRWLPSELR